MFSLSRKLVISVVFSTLLCVGCKPSTAPMDLDAPEVTSRPIPADTFLPGADRVVAIGDVHGDYQATLRALELAGVIDKNIAWVGEETVIVQVGDQIDRGDGEQKILDLFERLADEAFAAGGAVHALLGNHEIMNGELDFRYVTQGGWEDFADTPYDDSDALYAKYPESERGRVAAFRPGGPYATLLAGRNVTMVVGDTVFVHGGLLISHVDYGLASMNKQVQKWLRGNREFPAIMDDSDTSPVWIRHYSDEPDKADCLLLEGVLQALSVERMVVAHTVQSAIFSQCDDQVWLVDVGMADYYGGSASVLEIIGGKVSVLTPQM